MFVGNNRQIKVRRADLLEKLRTNLAKHQAEHAEAQQNWEQAAKDWAADAATRTQAGDFTDLRFDIHRPTDNSPEIERAIVMIDMSTEDEIALDEQTFTQWVQGEWAFSRHLREIAVAASSLSGALRSKALV